MSVFDLFSQLSGLQVGRHTFSVVPAPRCDGAYVGVDQAGRPCLFIAAQTRLSEPALRTTHVSFHPNEEYQLTFPDGTKRVATFHALMCDSADASDATAFLLLIEAFLTQNDETLSASQSLAAFFRSVVRLFAIVPAKDLAPERQGLWGELFTMRQTRGYQFWAPFWHSDTMRLFDFSAPGRRLEVKTTASGQRIHHFSHRQIYTIEDEEIVIASLLVQEVQVGLSLRDLITECREALVHTSYYLKLEKAARHAGMQDPVVTGPAYDPIAAARSLEWFRSTNIPHFCMPEPLGVSQTSYRVDLTDATRLDPDDLAIWLDGYPSLSASGENASRIYSTRA